MNRAASSPAPPETLPPPRAGHSKFRVGLRVLAGLVLFGSLLVEKLQLDALAALTAIPPWCWFLAGCFLAVLGWRGITRPQAVVLVLLTGAYWLFAVEQTHSLARSAWRVVFEPAQVVPAETLRVVTLNCATGSIKAAEEVASYRPEIACLQEAPQREALESLAERLYGKEAGVVWAGDCAILARGRLERVETPGRQFVLAKLTRPDGRAMAILSVRLSPPVVRYDLWNPACWREHQELRQRHRAECDTVVSVLQQLPRELPIVLAGDCNAPAGDGALLAWPPLLSDAFTAAGIGWGGTVLNCAPVLRFDQIWSTQQLRPMAIWAAASQASDHRLVVGDFQWPTAAD